MPAATLSTAPSATPAGGKGTTQTRLAVELLRQRIIEGGLPPGGKLNIALLAEEIGVSNGAVREALAVLETDALVVSEPQRGFRVSPISVEDLRHLTTARIHIEGLCLAAAMAEGGVEWESEIVAALYRLERHAPVLHRATPSREWTALHGEFHRTLASGCRNPWLRSMRETLYRQGERYRLFSDQSGPKPRDAGKEHRALVEALLARDGVRVNALLTSHLSRTAELVELGLKA
ncbi:MAG: GntR family transcriptional regulator [Pseudomonadota bacterium]